MCAAFDVVGRAWRDRVIRAFSGGRAEMTVRHAGGSIVLVASRFQRSLTYGLVSIHPRGRSRSQVRFLTWIRRRAIIGRAIDGIDVRIRANFIRAFLQSDIDAGSGIRYDPSRTINADALLVRYLNWVRDRVSVMRD